MKTPRLVHLHLIFLIVSLAMSMACVRKHPDRPAQGSDEGVHAKGSLDGRRFYLKTKDVLHKANTTSADTMTIEDPVKGKFNFLPVVQYETNSDLLGAEVPLRARPNQDDMYQLQYVLTDKYLKIYLITASESDLPTDLLAYKMVMADGMVGIPLVGYGVSYCRMENVLNGDQEKTHIQTCYGEMDSKDQGSHFRLNRFQRVMFQPVQLSDVMPRDYFGFGPNAKRINNKIISEYEYYFSQSTIEHRYRAGQVNLGWFQPDAEWNWSTRIRFVGTENAIYGLNTNIDEEISEQLNDLDRYAMIKINVSWHDLRLAIEGNDHGMRGESYSKTSWEDRPYLSLNVGSTVTGSDLYSKFVASFRYWTGKILQSVNDHNSGVRNITLAKDYFSYSMTLNELSKVEKYAFRRVLPEDDNDGYELKSLPEEDMTRYGLMWGTKKQVEDHRIRRREDIDKNRFVVRFHPKKDIIFRFSTLTPKNDYYRDIGREAIEQWQQAFRRAGLGINVVLKEDFEVELGDLRYNSMNIPMSYSDRNLGMVSAVWERRTGKIISANINMFVRNSENQAISYIRNYLMYRYGRVIDLSNSGGNTEIGQVNPNRLNSLAQGDLSTHLSQNLVSVNNTVIPKGYNPITFGNINGSGTEAYIEQQRNIIVSASEDFRYVPHQYYNSNPRAETVEKSQLDNPISWLDDIGLSLFRKVMEVFAGDGVYAAADYNTVYQGYLNENRVLPFLNDVGGMNSVFDSNTPYDKIMLAIDELCPEIDGFMAKYEGQRLTTELENSVVLPCARKLMPGLALETAVHEVGHSFGLHHNFAGSSDAKNFIKKGDFELKYLDCSREDNCVPDVWVASNTSSILDYVHAAIGLQYWPGEYDISALRYLYLDTVRVDGKDLKLNNRSIVRAVQDSGYDISDIQHYSYCGNWHNDRAIDPFCAMRDSGSTAVEVVTNKVNSYYMWLNFGSYRYNRMTAYSATRGKYISFLVPMKRFYDRWREYVLARPEVGEERQYINGIDIESYQAIVSNMVEDKRKTPDGRVLGEVHRDFYRARNLLFAFLVDIAFMPNKYCVVEHPDFGETLIELNRYRRILASQGSVSAIDSCQHPEVQELIASSGFRYLKERGHFLRGGKYSLDPTYSYLDFMDFSGSWSERLNAYSVLVTRQPMSIRNFNRDGAFLPNMLDEPDIRQAVLQLLFARVHDGVFFYESDNGRGLLDRLPKTADGQWDLDAWTPEVIVETILGPHQEKTGKIGYQRYQEEESLLINMVASTQFGLGVPNDRDATKNRRREIAARISGIPYYLRDLHALTRLEDGLWIAALNENTAIEDLLKKYEELKDQQDLVKLNAEDAKRIIEPIYREFQAEWQRLGLNSGVLAAPSFLEFMSQVIEKINYLAEQESKTNSPRYSMFLRDLMETELQVFQLSSLAEVHRVKAQVESGAGSLPATSQAQIQRVLNNDVGDTYARLRKKWPQRAEDFDERWEKAITEIETTAKKDEYFTGETRAHLNLLRTLFLIGASIY